MVGASPLEGSRIEGSGYPLALTGPAGDMQVIPAMPQRIVSMVLLGDEILTEIAAPGRLAGLTYFSTDPVSSNCVDRVPPKVTLVDDDPEQILSLEPDLLLASAYTETSFVRFMAQSGIPVLYLSGYNTIDDVRRNLRLIALATGDVERGEALVSTFDSRLEDVARRVAGLPRPRVLYFMGDSTTHGRGTTIDDIINRAGGTNVAATEAGINGVRRLAHEAAIALDPDVILLSRYGDGDDAVVRDRYLKNPDWREVSAVRTGRVYTILDRELINLSHHVASGVEGVARVLHPEAFTE